MPLRIPRLRRPWPGLLALAAGVAALAPAPARANGMPQLDFASPLTLGQVWWGAAIFLVFLLLSWRWALPQVARVLEQRAGAIAADLDAARAAKSDADRAAAEVATATAGARAEASAAITAAVETAQHQAAAQTAALNARLDGQLKQAETQIAAARAAALGALRQVATETAVTVITRLTGTLPDAGWVDQAVAAALDARGIGAATSGGQHA